MLASSRADRVIVISDTLVWYYTSASPDWEAERLLWTEGIELNGYRLLAQDEWLWDLGPQGIEFRDYGVVHRVEAKSFSSLDSAQSADRR